MSLPIVEGAVAIEPRFFEPPVANDTVLLARLDGDVTAEVGDDGFLGTNGVFSAGQFGQQCISNSISVGSALPTLTDRAARFELNPVLDLSDTANNPCTVEFWLYNAGGASQTHFHLLPDYGPHTNYPDGLIHIYGGNNNYFYFFDSTQTLLASNFTNMGVAWNHIAYVFKNNAVSLFLNGNRRYTRTVVDPVHIMKNIGTIYLGGLNERYQELRVSRVERYDYTQTSITVPTGPFVVD